MRNEDEELLNYDKDSLQLQAMAAEQLKQLQNVLHALAIAACQVDDDGGWLTRYSALWLLTNFLQINLLFEI